MGGWTLGADKQLFPSVHVSDTATIERECRVAGATARCGAFSLLPVRGAEVTISHKREVSDAFSSSHRHASATTDHFCC